jgi:hypothetical protein
MTSIKPVVISILNVLAFIPLAVFLVSSPIAFFTSFASPGSSSLSAWLFRIVVFVLIPASIVLLVYFSHKRQSLILAVIALYPLFYFGYKQYIAPTPSSKQFMEAKRDFVCSEELLVTLKEKGFGAPLEGMQWVSVSEKKGMGHFAPNDQIGVIYEGVFIPIHKLDYIKHSLGREAERNVKVVNGCVNSEGKTISNLYSMASDDVISEINDAIKEKIKR